MTIENTDGAAEIHDELGALIERVNVLLPNYMTVFGPGLYVPVLTSSTNAEDRRTDFTVQRDCMLIDLRHTIEPAASSTMNWTVGIDAINAVSGDAIPKWMLLKGQSYTYEYERTTASTNRVGDNLDDRHSAGIQLVTGLTYRIWAEVDHATGGLCQVIPIIRMPATTV